MKSMRSEILKKIDESKNTSQVNLANMAIKDSELKEILTKIKSSYPRLTVLNLDNNYISNEGALILTESLIDSAQLAELSLQHNNMGRKGALSIFSLKRGLPKIDILFRGNNIYDVGEMDEIERLSLVDSNPNLHI